MGATLPHLGPPGKIQRREQLGWGFGDCYEKAPFVVCPILKTTKNLVPVLKLSLTKVTLFLFLPEPIIKISSTLPSLSRPSASSPKRTSFYRRRLSFSSSIRQDRHSSVFVAIT